MYVEVKELAPVIRRALESVKYGGRDIKVTAIDTVKLNTGGGARGARGFVTVVNLESGEYHTEVGDWGGPGLGHRLADWNKDELTLSDNAVVIHGQMGYPKTFAYLYASPNAVGRFLPSGSEETLTDTEQDAIYCFTAIKGGEYRRDELRRREVAPETVDSLVDRGYLKRSKSGATQITTKGKNARTYS